jgi:uncharacterized repeat protein (TIGR01451 family)
MKILRVGAMAAVFAALLCGLLILLAPIGGAAAPERPPAPGARSEPAPGAAIPPADPAPAAAPQFENARLHPALLCALQAAADGGTGPARAPRSPSHPEGIAADPYLRIIIEWKRAPNIAAQAAAASDRLARREAVVAQLQADAQRGSAALQATLADAVAEGQARDVRSFWASPIIALEAQPDLIGSLSRRDDVVQIRLDEPFYLEDVPFQEVSSPDESGSLPWNLQMLDVGLAEQALGLDGSGVVVANLDTGVDWQHPALMKKYRGYRDRGFAVHWGNWHVSTGEPYLYPGDGEGHGTHTMGTIVGDDGAGNRLGVAPGARWIAVKLFDNTGATYESWIHDAFQWIMAPEGDPALAPDIVSNSWGSDASADDRFRPDVAALRAAGILPVFSAGNEGPGAGTISSPGSLPEALAVGAVDDERLPATFSGRGPSSWHEVKPEVTAPGVNVVSSFPGGGLAKGTGTSMAAPHVAGLAALLLQANPNLTPDQIENLLKAAAVPLGTVVPNNVTGWGLVNAYAAGLRVTSSGEITGRVARPDGGGIPCPAITAASHDGVQHVTASGDAGGAFTLALRPGLYDVTAGAFGFDPATRAGVEVRTGVQTEITLTLTARPAGSFFGRVTDLQTGAPLSATIIVEGTPATTRTDPATGLYSLALPAGHYTASVKADAHRIGRLDLDVEAGLSQQADIILPSAPRILLVDSGRWYYDSQIRFFEDALTSLDYLFELWTIRDPFGFSGGTGDRPAAEDLAPYDIVIWSSPQDSPGLIEVDEALTDYLAAGGRLLVSGQDVAYWDGGGSPFNLPAPYFTSGLGLRFGSEGNLAALSGITGTPFAGLSVALNTPDSARQQETPDAARILDRRATQPVLRWPDNTIGGATTGICRPWRAAWLGFGLEGAGPRDARINTLGRTLDWLMSSPPAYGLVAQKKPRNDGASGDAPLIGLPGDAVSQTIRLDNIGAITDTVDLLLDPAPWPMALDLPDGRHVEAGTQLTLGCCSGGLITVTISIPAGEPRDARSINALRFVSRGDPQATAAVTLTAKTPAPILFVDDERWYDHQDEYTTTLDALELSYDLFNTQGGGSTPGAAILERYPLVVWTTGYDWYSPLSADDEVHLGSYLDSGGRLLLSSQDTLDVRGINEFTRNRLGVAEASLSVTGTEVIALPGSPLGADLGPWALTFPFPDWSDALIPTAQARGTLQDERLFTASVTRPAQNWRTAFFAFPLETLADSPRRALLGRTLVWLSPMGESRLEAPPAAAEGSRIPITLTLGLATGASQSGLRAVLPLPPQAALTPGSLRGPWDYDPAARTLLWIGDLSPDQKVVLGANLDLATGIPDGTILPLSARLYAGDGVTLTAEAPLRVDVPWLELQEQVEPAQPGIKGSVQYTLTVRNRGPMPAFAVLTDTLPAGMVPLAGSAWSSTGETVLLPGGLTWQGVVAPAATVSAGYRARLTIDHPGARLIDRAELTDQFGRRVVAWAIVRVPTRCFLPLVPRN